jgi:hypothetical protein
MLGPEATAPPDGPTREGYHGDSQGAGSSIPAEVLPLPLARDEMFDIGDNVRPPFVPIWNMAFVLVTCY